MNNDLVRWRYMLVGDMLEYKDKNGIVKQVGPIQEIDWRKDRDTQFAPTKKHVLVPALREPAKFVPVPLYQVQAVIRGGVEVIRFTENEQQSVGCAACGQRAINPEIAGKVFCSLHCQAEWIERYYGDYPPGENPIDKKEYIHTTNCGDCRKLNRIYCPNCVD